MYGQEQVEYLDQAAAIDPVDQPQVELPADRGVPAAMLAAFKDAVGVVVAVAHVQPPAAASI